jgi:hypothetical protein
MSVTKKAFLFYKKMVLVAQNKGFQNYVFVALAFFFVLGMVLNRYAHAQGYDITGAYNEVDNFSTASTGTAGFHSHKTQGFKFVDSFGSMLDLVYPQGNVNYEAILADPNISEGAKLGVIGTIDIPFTAMIQNPPNVDVVEHLAQEWVPNYKESRTQVYAETGYEMLAKTNITGLWNLTRNIAYMLFVVVFIVAGFMIMFRQKLGGQTMVTVYNTLPSIVIGLVLVTFSFAIVGLILDIQTLLINMIRSLLDIESTSRIGAADPLHPFGLWGRYQGMLFMSAIQEEIGLRTGVITDLAGNIGPLLFRTVTGGLIQLIAALVGAIILAVAAIKVFFTLLKAYISIIIDTIMAPIFIAISTIPGKRSVLKDWFNRILKNSLTYVVVFLLVNLPIYIYSKGIEFNLFSGSWGIDLVITQSILLGIISIYLLFMAANVPKLLDEYFPQIGGKGALEAQKGMQANMQKIPFVGGMFK